MNLVYGATASSLAETDNLLLGLSAQTRDRLLTSIDSILNEMQVAKPEDFLFSPSKIPFLFSSQSSLKQALCFCRSLVLKAVSVQEKAQMIDEL